MLAIWLARHAEERIAEGCAVAVDEFDGDAEGYGEFVRRHAVEEEVAFRAERGPGEIERLPEGFVPEPFREVAAREQARDRHLSAEEAVFHGIYADGDPGAASGEFCREGGNGLVCRFSRGDRDLAPDRRLFLTQHGEREAEFVRQRGQHPDAVVDLGVVAVEIVVREGRAALDVEFVRGVEEPRGPSVLPGVIPAEFLVEGVDLPDDGGAFFGRERFERIEAVPVRRESDGNDRDGIHGRPVRREVAHRSFELRAVVESAAQHDLPPQRDPGVGEAAQIL